VQYRRRDVLWRQAGGVLVVADPVGHDAPRSLVGPGAAVWVALDEPGSIDEITALLADVFSADEATVRATVLEVLDALEGSGFVERIS
jgi:hypothetical protein